jgi:chromate transporter
MMSGARNAGEVFAIFLRLGLTSFGGPIAHLGYFREEFVARRRWFDERAYAQIVALCQFLPGPASSQVGIIIGYERAGLLGSLAAWCGFTLPSATAMVAFAYGIRSTPNFAESGWVHGLLVAAVAIVAFAVANMAATLAPDAMRRTLAAAGAIASLVLPSTGYTQVVVIGIGAILGWIWLRDARFGGGERKSVVAANGVRSGDPRLASICAGLFLLLIIGLPFVERGLNGPLLVFAKFFEVGGLVFGGGHVVLPLLQAQVVPPGWITNASFLAGYGAAQAIPGPLFTFSAYLGAAMVQGPVHGIAGAAICLVAIFAPSFLLIAGILPFWQRLIGNPSMEALLRGVNAAVLGVLLAALYNPVWVTAVHSARDVAVLIAGLLALAVWRVPPWTVVIGSSLICGVL